MDGYLPESVLWRKKSPYPKTYDPRYRQLVADRLRRLLQRKDAPIFQLVEKKPMEDLLESDLTWPWYGQLMGTPQTIAFLLQINFWLENYNISLRF
jgi:asparagine synthase (glutamine-hydrolysing)